MDIFWKSSAGILISLVLIITLSKQERDMSTILSIAVCSMVGITAIKVFEPVVDFLYEVCFLVSAESSLIKTLLQITGIALVAEFVGILCTDAGSTSLGKSIHLLSATVMLYQSVPILQGMLDMIREILGGL